MSSAWGNTVASRSFPTFSGGEKHSGVSKPTFFTLEGGEELLPNDGRISLLPGFSCYSWIGGRRRAVRDGQGERGRLRIAMRASCRVDRCPSCESAGLNLRLPLSWAGVCFVQSVTVTPAGMPELNISIPCREIFTQCASKSSRREGLFCIADAVRSLFSYLDSPLAS